MVNKLLRGSLFSFDLLRLIFIVLSFTFITIKQAEDIENFFPYLAYISTNALFPLISFFIFIKPLEYINHLNLYMAGKAIAVVLFYLWAIFTFQFSAVINNAAIMGMENFTQIMIILGGAFIISLWDTISILEAWFLKKLYRNEYPEHEGNGGV